MEAVAPRRPLNASPSFNLRRLPTMQLRLSSLMLVSLVAAAVTLGGCGRRGPLEAPPGAPDARPASTSQSEQTRNPAFATHTGLSPTPTGEMPDGLPPAPASVSAIRLDAPGMQGAPPQIAGRPAVTGPNERRSPPPRTPFILDPLL
jgi:predicted small lipoprotein YifL